MGLLFFGANEHTSEARTSESCSLTPVTDSYGACIPIGDSSSVMPGVVVESRAISLTRDVPFGLGWAIEPIIKKLPKESLINTLAATRQALHAGVR